MKHLFKKGVIWARKHKIYSGIIIITVLVGVYFGYTSFASNTVQTRYVLAEVRRGTITVSVSGSGQVSASNQVDIKTKASGETLFVPIIAGKYVNAGAVIAQLDSHDAQKSVRDAELALQNAKLAFEKIKGPEGAVVPRNKEQAAADLARAYDDGFTAVANAFIDFPSLLTGFEHLLTDKTLDKSQENISWYANQISQSDELARARAEAFRDAARASYSGARAMFDASFDAYKAASRASAPSILESLILQTYNSVRTTADAIKTMSNYIDFVRDVLEGKNYSIPTGVSTQQVSLNAYTGTLNGHLTKLLSAANTIKDAKNKYADADIDLASQALSIKQKENALQDAEEKLVDYTVRAPFAGIIAKLNVNKGDDVSLGTVVATLITTRKIAEISLNEVDAAHISLGQKAALSFDAVPGVKTEGVVSEVDTVGTMSQGVVSYTVKISFALADARVKPGMSVTADIATETADNALIVPNSAIKTMGNRNFIEVAVDGVPAGVEKNQAGVELATPPQRKQVEVGLTNDVQAQILSGLSEGDIVVARTIEAGAAAPAPAAGAQNNAAFRIPGLGGGGGRFAR